MRSLHWTSLTAPYWYGEHNRLLQVASETALWYHSGMPVIALRWVLIRDPLGQFETQALLCTDVHATPAFILDCFVQRWQMEVTFEEARAHLGVETQRQWSGKAIARTTPCLLGLYSIVTLLAQPLFWQSRRDYLLNELANSCRFCDDSLVRDGKFVFK